MPQAQPFTASRGHCEANTSALPQVLLLLPSTQECPKGFLSVLAHHTLEPWPHSHDKVATLSTKSWLNMSGVTFLTRMPHPVALTHSSPLPLLSQGPG